MKKICLFIATFVAAIGIANAAVRDGNSVNRTQKSNTVTRTDTNAKQTMARTTAKKTVSRATTPRIISRNTQSRTARTTRAGTARTATTVSAARSASNIRSNTTKKTTRKSTTAARAGTTPTVSGASNTFDAGYNTCRDAYFTCMDQFCAHANETYRRCICSSKLPQVQSRERALGQAADQLIDFKNLNLDVINKTAAEVTAMLSATAGEYAQSTNKDTSNSAKQLAGISDVLAKSKNKSLSTQGTVDIAGNINAIWSTTDLAGGANIANLTGEALYNAVHAQCSEMVIDKCTSEALQNMVTTAYGMYIENDCSALLNALDGQKTTANSNIRQTEREMQLARLENYNAHNSTSINDCIAQVRSDITTETACGKDYVHCLDVTGLYLNRETGTPIYSPNFYQLEVITSLSGDVLTNQTNRLLVAELNRKRDYAKRALDTCRDVADEVWDEFLRQAISEIYQGQQERVRTVKNECLDVVNKCYDEQTKSLKDFSNIKEQLLLGQRIELSEEMCRDKLTACSNLYGGGSSGMQELLIAMHNLTNQKIANQCLTTLQDFARDLCAVPGNDTLHAYPYSCRVYTPGEQTYATNQVCNQRVTSISNPLQQTPIKNTDTIYQCTKIYTSCNIKYYLLDGECYPCPEGAICQNEPGKTYSDIYGEGAEIVDCGNYVGSLYHKIARYAMQTCVRPSESQDALPATVLQDINVVMDQIHTDMSNELARECERLGGTWATTKWIDKTGDYKHDVRGDYLHKKFYDNTSANTEWGYCSTESEDLAKQTNTATDASGGNTNTPTVKQCAADQYSISFSPDSVHGSCCISHNFSFTQSTVCSDTATDYKLPDPGFVAPTTCANPNPSPTYPCQENQTCTFQGFADTWGNYFYNASGEPTVTTDTINFGGYKSARLLPVWKCIWNEGIKIIGQIKITGESTSDSCCAVPYETTNDILDATTPLKIYNLRGCNTYKNNETGICPSGQDCVVTGIINKNDNTQWFDANGQSQKTYTDYQKENPTLITKWECK